MSQTTSPSLDLTTNRSVSDPDALFKQFMGIAQFVAMRDGANAVISLDTETTGFETKDGTDHCIGISMSVRIEGTSYMDMYVPIRHPDVNVSPEIKLALKEFLENFEGWVVFHNAKFDLASLRTAGINYTGKFYDTLLMCHLIDENRPYSKDLDACVKHYVDKQESKKNDELFTVIVKQFGWGNVPYFAMRAYAEWDARITLMLYYAILKKFQQEVPAEYWDHKQDFLRVVDKMESRGVRIDQEFSLEQAQKGVDRMTELRRELKLNPASGKDLEKLLIDQLKLPVVKRSPSGKISFDKSAMEVYEQLLERDDNPLAGQILEYRGWQKTVSSNYRAYLKLVSQDGRLRPNYKLHGTKTGRMSCEQPNLQQIPRESDKEWNGTLKHAFIPQDGWELWEFDYSQLELRLATAYADEKELKKVFLDGRDIFTEMSKTLGFDRQDTKTFVYSVKYGAGLTRIAAVFKVTTDKASALREHYRNTYPGFRKVEALAASRCRAVGKVRLWSGRHRHFWSKRDDAHKAFNSAIQGGAADIVEHVMVRLFNRVDNDNECRMLLQVHDSIVFEIRKDRVADLVPEIKSIMEDVQPDFGVKFAVEGKVWGSK